MASTIVLKRRISSITGTRQITKAMELVSASKLRRAQEYAQRSRAYRDLAYELLTKLNSMSEVTQQPLFQKREKIANQLFIVVTSNSGLAGAYNANVLKQLTHDMQNGESAGKPKNHIIAIGNKGAQFARRLRDVDLLAAFPAFGDHPTANDLRPVLNMVMDTFKSGEIDSVKLIYTQFISTVNQKVQNLQLLPAQLDDTAAKETLSNFEPDVETVIDQVVIRLVEAQIWQAVLESMASEHAMRMVAMKNATDNAKDLIDDYTLELNTARQGAITQELAEITGGAEALK